MSAIGASSGMCAVAIRRSVSSAESPSASAARPPIQQTFYWGARPLRGGAVLLGGSGDVITLVVRAFGCRLRSVREGASIRLGGDRYYFAGAALGAIGTA